MSSVPRPTDVRHGQLQWFQWIKYQWRQWKFHYFSTTYYARTFSGAGAFSEWIEHFEAVAAINQWDDEDKLLWLRVRLVGGAQTAYGHLPAEAKESYSKLKKALKGRFEPEAMKERHLAQFQAQRKTKMEGWAEFADAIKLSQVH